MANDNITQQERQKNIDVSTVKNRIIPTIPKDMAAANRILQIFILS